MANPLSNNVEPHTGVASGIALACGQRFGPAGQTFVSGQPTIPNGEYGASQSRSLLELTGHV